eukprot:403365274
MPVGAQSLLFKNMDLNLKQQHIITSDNRTQLQQQEALLRTSVNNTTQSDTSSIVGRLGGQTQLNTIQNVQIQNQNYTEKPITIQINRRTPVTRKNIADLNNEDISTTSHKPGRTLRKPTGVESDDNFNFKIINRDRSKQDFMTR